MKIPKALRRRLNIWLVIYLDDILVMGSLLEEIMMSRDTSIFVLQNLGFVINFQNLIWTCFDKQKEVYGQQRDRKTI